MLVVGQDHQGRVEIYVHQAGGMVETPSKQALRCSITSYMESLSTYRPSAAHPLGPEEEGKESHC